MPIHIIRDVALTIRSFYKRITDFLRYRHATRDMNERYPDATVEEIAREDVCIICRETMRPWRVAPLASNPLPEEATAGEGSQSSLDARLRPKKLPCGHILHFACLRSWLERQQNCPTCRRPVLASSTVVHAPIPQLLNQPARLPHANFANGGVQVQAPIQQAGIPQNRIRIFSFGPFRVGFGAGQDLQGLAQHVNRIQPVHQPPPPGQVIGNDVQGVLGQQANQVVMARFSPNIIQAQLQSIEQHLMQQINSLRAQADQLYMVRALQGELARLRISQADQGANTNAVASDITNHRTFMPSLNGAPTGSTVQTFGQNQQTHTAIPETLPPGLTIPEGWSFLPLQRLPQNIPAFMTIPESFNGAGRGRGTDAATPQFSSVQSPIAGLPVPSPNGAASYTEGTLSPNTFISNTLGVPSSSSHDAETLHDRSRDQTMVQQQGEGEVNDPYSGHRIPTTMRTSTEETTIPQWAPVSGSAPKADSLIEGATSSPIVSHATSLDDGQSSVVSSRAKGKGRAVTVEDAAEDVD